MIATGRINMSAWPRALLACISVVGASWAHADGGYLVLSGGVARTQIAQSLRSGPETQKAFRFAAGMDFNPSFGLEIGVGTAGPYKPPALVASQTPGARLKITTIDLALLARYSPVDRVRLFAALGPSLTSSRTELPAARGPTTTLTSHKKLTWRAAVGLDFAVTDHVAMQVSAARLGAVNVDAGVDGTARHTVDSLLVGVLVQF